VKVQVLHADGAERKIGLSIKAANRSKELAEAQGFNSPNAGGATLGDKFRGKLDKLKPSAQ
jgi:predicted RNA-binding protein with RPS1 domain